MFYCKSNKFETSRFQSLKNVAFKKHSSIGNLVSFNFQIKKKICSFLISLRGHDGDPNDNHHIFFSPFPISFTFSYSQLTAPFPILIHPHTNPLFSVCMGFTLYLPSLTALFCEFSFTDSFSSFFLVQEMEGNRVG